MIWKAGARHRFGSVARHLRKSQAAVPPPHTSERSWAASARSAHLPDPRRANKARTAGCPCRWPAREVTAMAGRERALVWFLRAYAALLLLALPAAVLPTRWLAWSYEALGLGEWPPEPLLEYLARSASLLYALVGGMALLWSFDPPRYRPL